MDQPKISVIVPVYNPGSYFEKCLTSLLNQTLKEIEIVIILDCPTDESDKIAEKYAKQDTRIKLIRNEKNIHAGLSRNKGLEIASGKYIGFHDADDYSELNMYELLYQKAIQEELEVVRCDYKCICPKKSKIADELYQYPEITKDASKKKEIYEKVCNGTVSCVVWNHIFKSDFLRYHQIRFVDSSVITSEDSVFFIEVYKNVSKLGTLSDCLYYHIFHQTNMGASYGHRKIQNRIAFFEILYNFLKENNVKEKEALSYLSANVMKSLYTASRQVLTLFPLKKALNEIGLIRNNVLTMKCINYMYERKNRRTLFQLKYTIIIFFLLIKSFNNQTK